MDKIEVLKMQKILQEYSFLDSDYEYKNEIVNTYKGDFLKEIGEKSKDLEEKLEPVEQSKEPIEKDVPVASDVNIEKCKSIYREIVKITHPDKTNSENLIEFYIKAKTAYEEYNLFDLYLIASKLNLKIGLEVEDYNLLIQLITIKRDKIKKIEDSWLWSWLSAKDEDKENIVNIFIEKTKGK